MVWAAAPCHFADKGVTLPAERDDDLGVVAVHLLGDIDDDRTVSLGKIEIGKLHNRDNPAIDREPEHRLGQALHIANDLLGRLGHSSEDMDLGDGSTFGDHPRSFDPRETTDLLFEITKVHNLNPSCRGRW